MGQSRPKSRGICNRCGKQRTLVSLLRGYCKPCGYEWGNCIRCKAYRKIYIRGRCYLCYQDDLVRARLDQLDFVPPASIYNSYLFELYLKYIRRHRMSYDHLKPTMALSRYLGQGPVNPICCWNDIYNLSRKLPLTRRPGKSTHDNGCAWMKIGYMLQELGVLGPRCDEYQHRIDKLFEDMDPNSAEHVMAFTKLLKKSGRTDASVIHYLLELRSLSHWLSELDPPETLLLALSPSIECYFEFMCRMRSYASVVVSFRRVAAFYRVAKKNKLILQDPTQNVVFSRPAQKILICSKTQFDQLSTFLKDPNTSPNQALAVTLILFFGLTTADLAGACLDTTHEIQNQIKIILTRKPTSRGRRFYNREQTLKIPLDPYWLKNLSLRFLTRWQTSFAKILPKASFPKTPLFLDPQFLHNRHLSDAYICSLVKTATANATGTPIPPRVLKQTCGHIMVSGNDASALAHLGWSPQFAFHYTWLPRVQFQPKSSL